MGLYAGGNLITDGDNDGVTGIYFGSTKIWPVSSSNTLSGNVSAKSSFPGYDDLTNVTSTYSVSGAEDDTGTYSVSFSVKDGRAFDTSGTYTASGKKSDVNGSSTIAFSENNSKLTLTTSYTIDDEDVTDDWTWTGPNTVAAATQFACSDWTGTVSVAVNGTISATTGNAQTYTINTSDFASNSSSCNTVSRTVSISVQVPNDSSTWTNANQSITCSVSATQPAGQSNFAAADWTGSASVSSSGTITVTDGNLTGVTTTPTSFSSNTGCNTTPRAMTISGTVNDSSFCNNNQSVSFTYITNQAGSGTKYSGSPSVTSLNADGTYTVDYDGLTSGSVSFNGGLTDRSKNCSSITKYYTITGTIPSGYCDTGKTSTTTGSISQPGGGSDFDASTYSGTVTISVSGAVSATSGSDFSLSSFTPTSFPSNSSACESETQKVTIVGDVEEGTSYCNAGDEITFSVNATQGFGGQSLSISCSGIAVNANGVITGCPAGATCTGPNGETSFSKVKTDTSRTITATRTVGAGYCNAGDTITCSTTVTQAASAANSLSISPSLMQFDGEGNELGGDTIMVTVTPSNNFTVSDNAGWITTSTSGNVVTVSVTANDGDSNRKGTVTITHSLDSSLTSTCSVSQTGGQEV